ncbi:MAG: hypothetical protein ACYSR6_13785 [Planctomycetota bacterium]
MAGKKYFRITAGVKYERDFYVQAQDKDQALEELEELNFEKAETVLFSGKIELDVVDKEQDIVEVTEEEAQPRDVIQSIKEVMEEQGFALVTCGQGINGAQGYAFMHRQTGEYIGVQEEELDEEEMWDVLGVTEEEIRSRIEERNKTEDFYTGEEMDNKIGDWQDEDYEAVILDIIDEKAREVKDHSTVHSEGEQNA